MQNEELISKYTMIYSTSKCEWDNGIDVSRTISHYLFRKTHFDMN
jgi:hypothetical protein